jgi:hypothetical protein
MHQIIAKLTEVFAPYDAQVVEDTKKWAMERQAAINEFKKSEEYKILARKSGQWELYDKLFAMAGGKTWYNALWGRNATMIHNYVEKYCAAVANKRTASIAAKLTKAGVTEVVSESYVYTKDGFNGTYVVETNSGKKIVTIDTIIAGGYNIQCAHMRVLVKVK